MPIQTLINELNLIVVSCRDLLDKADRKYRTNYCMKTPPTVVLNCLITTLAIIPNTLFITKMDLLINCALKFTVNFL